MDSKAIAQAGQAVVVDAHAALIKRCRSDLKAAKEEANDIEARLEMIEHEKEMLEREKQELETRNYLQRRIDEATRFIPLDQLAISPQCGFASDVVGNLLTEA